jgi:thioredoxin reductase (NADPH)
MNSLIIIGSGPAAFTAAIYAARANLQPIILEGELSEDMIPGGQLMTTTDIENFPGFPEGIDGSELMDNMRKQALRFGSIIKEETVKSVDLKTPGNFLVQTNSQSYTTKSIIVSTGAVAKRLNFEGSETFWMKGISACAVCDGALPMFRNKVLAVIGGGDTACEEATFLSKYGSTVLIFVRRDKMRASKIMQDRVLNNPKIKVIYDSEVVHAGSEKIGKNLGFVRVLNSKTEQTSEFEVSGLFFAIGHKPASDFLAGQVATNSEGYIVTSPNSTQTSVPGVFAAGDVQDYKWRQAITAAGSGCMAALECEHYLQALNH